MSRLKPFVGQGKGLVPTVSKILNVPTGGHAVPQVVRTDGGGWFCCWGFDGIRGKVLSAAEGLFHLVGVVVCGGGLGGAHGSDALEEVHPPVQGQVGTGPNGATVGQDNEVEGPSAVAVHGQCGLHVDLVHVRSFLAVNFDVYKQIVHERSGFGVFKTFVGHYVAPVTRRVPNRKKYWLAGSSGESKRIFSPRIPIDRIVAMLAKVRADFVTEAIGHVRKS